MFTTLFIATTIFVPNPYRNERPNLVGITIMPQTTGTAYTIPEPTGTRTGTLSKTDYIVVRDDGQGLWVREGKELVLVARQLVLTPKEAIVHFGKQVAENPQNAYYRRSKAYELLNDWDAALKDYDELVKLFPNVSAYWNNRGNLWSRKKEYEKALADYEKALPISTTTYITLGNIGNVHSSQRQWDKALEYYDKSITANGNYARGYAGRAIIWREKREYAKALDDAEAAIKYDVASAFGFNARGLVYVSVKDYAKALADCNMALEQDSTFAAGYLNRGSLHLLRKELQPAMRDLDKAIVLLPAYTAAYSKRAETWLACGNIPLALADTDAAIASDKNYPHGYRVRGWILATTTNDQYRDGAKALEAAKQALELAKEGSGSFYETLAVAHAEVGNFAEAITWQKKALVDKEYVKERGEEVQKRIALFEAKKPYRE